jgi:hypothetical protein
MTKVFEVVYKRDSYQDLSEVLDRDKGPNFIKVNSRESGGKTQKSLVTDDGDDDMEYMEKVKKYTSFLIGSKFNENT